jgi:hypothetical protein
LGQLSAQAFQDLGRFRPNDFRRTEDVLGLLPKCDRGVPLDIGYPPGSAPDGLCVLARLGDHRRRVGLRPHRPTVSRVGLIGQAFGVRS